MDTSTPSDEQHSLLLSIIRVLTMALIYLAIHRRFDSYLHPRGSRTVDQAALIEKIRCDFDAIEKQLDFAETTSLESRQLVIQARDSVLLPQFDDIEKRLEQVGADSLTLRRRIIQLHDRALSIYPKLRKMHAAKCTLTPERREIFMLAEESKTATGEEGHRCHQELEGA